MSYLAQEMIPIVEKILNGTDKIVYTKQETNDNTKKETNNNMIIYALHDECHGIIGYYANDYTAKERCKENAKLYDIDPATTELDYVGAWHWGWTDSYIERIDVIED